MVQSCVGGGTVNLISRTSTVRYLWATVGCVLRRGACSEEIFTISERAAFDTVLTRYNLAWTRSLSFPHKLSILIYTDALLQI